MSDPSPTPHSLERLVKELGQAQVQEQKLAQELAKLRAQHQSEVSQLAEYLRQQLGATLAAEVGAALAPAGASRGLEAAPSTGRDLGPAAPSFAIRFDYDKARAHPIRWDAQGKPIWYGYSLRPTGDGSNPVPLTGIVLHSTEGPSGETWPNALEYIRDTPEVSAHYYVGRSGEIQRILDPGPYRAWHAGISSYNGLADWNNFAVGIELHHTKGDAPYPPAQTDALRWLCRALMADHPTIKRENIALHRWIAVDDAGHTGRKIDPTDLDDAFWKQWIAAL